MKPVVRVDATPTKDISEIFAYFQQLSTGAMGILTRRYCASCRTRSHCSGVRMGTFVM